MWPSRTIAFFISFWVLCALALTNPIFGIVNYVLVYQMNPTNTWWGRPLSDIGIRFSMLAAATTILGLAIGRKHVPSIRPIVSPWEIGVFLLVALGALGLAIGYEYGPHTVTVFEKLWKMMLFVIVIGRIATTRPNVKIFLWSLVIGTLYIAYDAYTAPPSSFWLGRLESIGGPDFATTSGTGAHLSAMLPLIGVVFLITPSWKLRALAAVTGALAVNAIIMCRTRSAFIGLAAGAVIAVLAAPKARRYRIHLMIGVGSVLAFSMADEHFITRMKTLTDPNLIENDPAAATRVRIWQLAAEIIADHPMGVGPGNFTRIIGDYQKDHYKRSSHNTVVVCLTELGVIGGIVLMLMVVGSMGYLYKTARLAERSDAPLETKMMVYGSLIAVVTYFVTGLGTERFYCESYWWVMVLPMCLNRMVRREVFESATELLPVTPNDDHEELPALGYADPSY